MTLHRFIRHNVAAVSDQLSARRLKIAVSVRLLGELIGDLSCFSFETLDEELSAHVRDVGGPFCEVPISCLFTTLP